MVDLSDKGSESDDMNSRTPDRVSSEGDQIRTCADCGTMKTPLWRGGPAGPKSLCNACGIRSRKRRRALLGLNKTEDKKPKRSNGNSNGNGNNHNRKLGESIKMMKLFALSSLEKKLRRKLGEEEQAAVLLMALSCGSVYA